jgi:phenylalanyl-tRNA synthetase beta chain
MKISLNWLKELIDINGITANEIKEVLTSIGLEVASIEKYHPIQGGLEGLVIGQVLEASKIEGTNNLSATKVDIGGKVLDIVCGAPNVAKGQKVVVATVGTTLHYKGETLKIKKVKLRGHVSEGMICAEDEIGIGDSHEGILVLDDTAPVGKAFKDYVNIPEDTVIEIDITEGNREPLPIAISDFFYDEIDSSELSTISLARPAIDTPRTVWKRISLDLSDPIISTTISISIAPAINIRPLGST